tara:strand:+ start:5993 stop:6742 length:750 start_codon:yes stop_codon:yes gene_type:complete
MKKQEQYVNKTYRLMRDAAPLSFMLPVRNSRRSPLLHFDEDKGINRPLRYAVNQKSPFEDEQDGNAIVEPIVFEDGFLNVPRTNQVLQEFLHYHPLNGKRFEEVNDEKDAAQEVEWLNEEVDALVEARKLTVDQLETLGRVAISGDVSTMTTAELRRDMLIFAKHDPQGFLRMVSDPMVKLQSNVQKFFDEKLLAFRNNQKEVYFNLSGNKKRMMSLPYGEEPMYVVTSYLQSDEGVEILEYLEGMLEE